MYRLLSLTGLLKTFLFYLQEQQIIEAFYHAAKLIQLCRLLFHCLLCLTSTLYVLAPSHRDVFFSLLIIVATHFFYHVPQNFQKLFLVSRKKRIQILLLDHSPSLSFVLLLCLDRVNQVLASTVHHMSFLLCFMYCRDLHVSSEASRSGCSATGSAFLSPVNSKPAISESCGHLNW